MRGERVSNSASTRVQTAVVCVIAAVQVVVDVHGSDGEDGPVRLRVLQCGAVCIIHGRVHKEVS